MPTERKKKPTLEEMTKTSISNLKVILKRVPGIRFYECQGILHPEYVTFEGGFKTSENIVRTRFCSTEDLIAQLVDGRDEIVCIRETHKQKAQYFFILNLKNMENHKVKCNTYSPPRGYTVYFYEELIQKNKNLISHNMRCYCKDFSIRMDKMESYVELVEKFEKFYPDSKTSKDIRSYYEDERIPSLGVLIKRKNNQVKQIKKTEKSLANKMLEESSLIKAFSNLSDADKIHIEMFIKRKPYSSNGSIINEEDIEYFNEIYIQTPEEE